MEYKVFLVDDERWSLKDVRYTCSSSLRVTASNPAAPFPIIAPIKKQSASNTVNTIF